MRRNAAADLDVEFQSNVIRFEFDMAKMRRMNRASVALMQLQRACQTKSQRIGFVHMHPHFVFTISFASLFVVGIFDSGNYEIDLPDVDLGYLSFYDIARLHVGFTLCFWLRTEHSGFFIEYKVAKEQNESLLLGVYCLNNSVSTQLANKRR